MTSLFSTSLFSIHILPPPPPPPPPPPKKKKKKNPDTIGTTIMLNSDVSTKNGYVVVWRYPDSKVHGANMGPIWGRQDPGGPH